MYRNLIRTTLAKQGFIGTDPGWVEAWMRLEQGTLDALSPAQFASEVTMAVECIRASSDAANRELAASYGLSA